MNFSTRLEWAPVPNRLTRLLMEKRRAGEAILDLTESNPTRAGFDYPAAIAESFGGNEILRYEPDPRGSSAARHAVSRYYAARGLSADPAQILLTASTSEAYAYLFKLLCNPGDEVLAPRPSYPLFEFLAKIEAVSIRQYPLTYHGRWGIDLGTLEQDLNDRTRAIVVVNPNNPTGSFLKRSELEVLERLCGARGLALISDEVFSDYAFAPDAERVTMAAAVKHCLAFSLSGLSKVAGLPQMKLGWIVAGGPDAVRRRALEGLEWIADTYLSVSTPVQCAAAELLRLGKEVASQILARTARNLASARTCLEGSAGGVLAVEGGWYIVIRVPVTRTEEEWALELLGGDNVLLQPGFFYDFESEAFLVASLLTNPVEFDEGLRRLRRRL
ncbi:MAG: pyridoxal phosphate-dependent aminotransferase [Bryobacteraceae bacterium]